MALTHGGQLSLVAKRFDLDEEGWLDLSTGISPFSYPIPAIPSIVWQQLPSEKASLIDAAKQYYGTSEIMVTNGSQSVIKALPQLWDKREKKRMTVMVPQVGYKEHEKAWQEDGFHVIQYASLPEPKHLQAHMIVVVINPNNPTTELVDPSTLKRLHSALQNLNGWLVIDEAFMDVYPKHYSMIGETSKGNLIVLRSVGKFFGLAGIRAGFVSCCAQKQAQLKEILGPWQVNGPALYLCEKVLQDTDWHKKSMQYLRTQSDRLKTLLLKVFCRRGSVLSTPLFVTVKTNQAKTLFTVLCHHKIYLRLCDENDSLRFGVTDNCGLERLKTALLSPKVKKLIDSIESEWVSF